MPDDPIKPPPIPKIGEQVNADKKALLEEAKILGDLDRAIHSNARAREKWGRTARQAGKDHESLAKTLEEEGKQLVKTTKEFLSFNRQIRDVGRSVGGFINKLSAATSVSQVYNNLLTEMRQGQKAYTQTLQATTNNISDASATSQKYINAVHDAYARAHKTAGEFNIESQELRRATDELTMRFGSQLGAMDDMSGALQSMQKEALILSRYIGTDMSGVMNMWQEQLEQTIGTLDDARGNIIMVAKETDQYAKELQELGEAFMRTGNIGKKEFIEMVRSLGKELRTGTIDAGAYSSALRGLLVEGKKSLLTMNEQRAVAEGSRRLMGDIFKFGSQTSIFGTQVAKKLISQWDDLSNIQNEGLRRRLEMVRERFAGAPEIQQIRAVMNVLQGSAAGSAEALRQISSATGIELSREIIAKFTEGNVVTADLIAKQIQSGELAKNFEKQATEEAQQSREEQVAVWKRSIEDLVKAGATPTDQRYKMIAQLESIKGNIMYIARKFPIIFGAMQLGASAGGALLKRVLAGRAATAAAGRLGSLGIPTATTVGGTAAGAGGAGTAAAGAGGRLAAGMGGRALGLAGRAGAFVGGRAIPVVGAALLGWEIGSAVAKIDIKGVVGKETKRMLGGDTTVADYLSHKLAEVSYIPGYQEMMKKVVRIEGKEVEKRKERIKQLDDSIKEDEKYRDQMTIVQQQELDAKKRQKEELEKTIKHITESEKEETKKADIERSVQRQAAAVHRLRELKGAKIEDPTELATKFLEDPAFKNMAPFLTGGFGQELMDILTTQAKTLGVQVKDQTKFVEEVRAGIAERVLKRSYGVETAGMSREDIVAEYAKRTGMKTTEIRAQTASEIAAKRGASFEEATKSLRIELVTDEGSQPVSVNAQGMLEFHTGQKMKIHGGSFLAAMMKVAQINQAGSPK